MEGGAGGLCCGRRRLQILGRRRPRRARRLQRCPRLSRRGGACLGGRQGLCLERLEGRHLFPQACAELVQHHGVEGPALDRLLHAAAGQGIRERLVKRQLCQQRLQGGVVLPEVLGLAIHDDLEVRADAALERTLALLHLQQRHVTAALPFLLVLKHRLRRLHGPIHISCMAGLGFGLLSGGGQRLCRPCHLLLESLPSGVGLDANGRLGLAGLLQLRQHALDDVADHLHHDGLRLVAFVARSAQALADAREEHLAAIFGNLEGLLDRLHDALEGRVDLGLLRGGCRRCHGGLGATLGALGRSHGE
mmetsp:Transcript_53182/g.152401  ORF Transcript_53182/g.152401 Transcript_53182/m.152401 type:complete len:306 (+) Transcript_53182:487-1404(+)